MSWPACPSFPSEFLSTESQPLSPPESPTLPRRAADQKQYVVLIFVLSVKKHIRLVIM